jgi:4,5-dihydroxyphthalate decarboxylase
MARLSLTFACWDYDRVRALQDERVRPEGIDLTVLPLPVEETFYRQLRYGEFEVSEMSLSSYVLTLDQPEPPFVALPVFPSRAFRHQSMYVNIRSGIAAPADLLLHRGHRGERPTGETRPESAFHVRYDSDRTRAEPLGPARRR